MAHTTPQTIAALLGALTPTLVGLAENMPDMPATLLSGAQLFPSFQHPLQNKPKEPVAALLRSKATSHCIYHPPTECLAVFGSLPSLVVFQF